MIIPTDIVLRNLSKAIQFVRNDLSAQQNDENTYLYRLTNQGSRFKHNYFQQLKASLNTNQSNPRHIDIRFGFDPDKMTFPSICVLTDADEYDKKFNDINGGRGTVEEELRGNTYSNIQRKRMSTNVAIIIISNNVTEVEFLYEFLKYIIFALDIVFSGEGLYNLNLSGRMIRFSDKVPSGTYQKALNLMFDYEFEIPDFSSLSAVTGINLNELTINVGSQTGVEDRNP